MEIAEIEIAANELNTMLVGCIVSQVHTSDWVKKRKVNLSQLKDYEIQGVSRFGKALLFRLTKKSKTKFMACRLGMSGKWKVHSREYRTSSWAASFLLEHAIGQIALVWVDPRKFSTVEIADYQHELECLRGYGPEIRSVQFTKEWVEFFCSRHQSHVYGVLMEQKYCPGMGNRLACEVLFIANVSPIQVAKTLNKEQLKRLYRAIVLVTSSEITRRGKGLPKENYVYRREGKPCRVCDSEIFSDKLKSKKIFWCSLCQSPKWKHPKPVNQDFVQQVIKTCKL